MPYLAGDLQGIFGALAGRAKEEKMRSQKFQDLFLEAVIKQKIQEQDPMYQFIKKAEMAKSLKAMTDIGVDVSGYSGMFENAIQSGQSFDSNLESQKQPNFQPTVQSTPDASNNQNFITTDYERTPFGKFVAKGAKDLNAVKKEEAAKELAKGIPTSESGKVTLAREALRNIDEIKGILFPKGFGSFDRETAFGSNPPALRLPFIGRVGASVRRDNPLDPTDNVKAKKAQTIFRKIGAVLSGRQLIQTGVAARPEETQKLVEQFAPGFFSNPESAIAGVNELQDFYKTYLYIVQTKGLEAAEEWARLQDTPGNVIQGRPPGQAQQYPRAVNQQTGQSLIYKDGKWQTE